MDHVNEQIKIFKEVYQDYITKTIEINPTNAFASISSLLGAIKRHETSIFLLIDEYDNFANELMLNKTISDQTEKDAYTLFVKKDGPNKRSSFYCIIPVLCWRIYPSP
jgi:histidyl-tRNA synthetase